MSDGGDKSNGDVEQRVNDSFKSASNGNQKSTPNAEQTNLIVSNGMETPVPEMLPNGKNVSESSRKRGRCHEIRRGAEVTAERTKTQCGKYWRDVCSIDNLKRRLPILVWLPKYRLSTFKCDLIAGLTVGLTVIPQGMAYADLAGLDLQYGLYSAFMGSFLYCLLGTSRDITLGPTAIMSILVAEYAHDRWGHGVGDGDHTTNVTLAILLAMMCGIIQILMAVFKLGFLVRYIPHSVISGFTSAASIVICMTQFKKLFGIKTPRGFFQTIYTIFRDIAQTRVFDLVLGVSCMIILFLLKYAKNRWSSTKTAGDEHIAIKILRKLIWIFGTGRNAFVVIIAAAIAYGITDVQQPVEKRPLTLTDHIEGGVPPFKLPSFTYDVPNSTTTVQLPELLSALGSALAVIPLIGFLEAIAIAKAFGRKHNYKVDPTQELFAIGLGNVVSSFVSSYPITGSFGRSAVNAQSNVMTPLGGIFTGTVVLLSLQFLSQAFQYIPAAALGAVIIMAVINLFDFAGMKHIWHVNKLDILPLIITFFLCFWDIAYGIMAGVGLSIVMLLMGHAKPRATTEKIDGVVIVRIKRGLDFPGAEYIEDKLQEQVDEAQSCSSVIVDCSNLTTLDFSGAEAFLHAAQRLSIENIKLKLCGVKRTHEAMLKRLDVVEAGVKFYDSVEEAKNEATPEEVI